MIRLPRLSAVAAGALALVAVSVVPARAQYGRPMVSDPAIGEKYHVEAIINFWNPSLDADRLERVAGHSGQRSRRQGRPGLRRQVDS